MERRNLEGHLLKLGPYFVDRMQRLLMKLLIGKRYRMNAIINKNNEKYVKPISSYNKLISMVIRLFIRSTVTFVFKMMPKKKAPKKRRCPSSAALLSTATRALQFSTKTHRRTST